MTILVLKIHGRDTKLGVPRGAYKYKIGFNYLLPHVTLILLISFRLRNCNLFIFLLKNNQLHAPNERIVFTPFLCGRG